MIIDFNNKCQNKRNFLDIFYMHTVYTPLTILALSWAMFFQVVFQVVRSVYSGEYSNGSFQWILQASNNLMANYPMARL